MSLNEVASGKHITLQNAFATLFMTNGGPRDAAMFTDIDVGENSYFYFSPEATRIASALIAKYGGVQCSPPTHFGKALLVGNADAHFRLLKAEDRS